MSLRQLLLSAVLVGLALAWWNGLLGTLPPGRLPGWAGGPDEKLSYDYYEARAVADRSLLRTLNAASPIRENGQIFHAYTRWHVRWNFRWSENPDGRCRVTAATTEVSGRITLPKLVHATRAQSEQFDRYLAALRVHELGHYRFGQDAAREIERGIRAMKPMATCRALETAANALGHATLDEFRQQERDYDQSTGYGETQGARLWD